MRLPAIRQSAFGELDSDTGWTLVEAFAAVHRWQSHHVGSFDQCFWLQHFGGPAVRYVRLFARARPRSWPVASTPPACAVSRETACELRKASPWAISVCFGQPITATGTRRRDHQMAVRDNAITANLLTLRRNLGRVGLGSRAADSRKGPGYSAPTSRSLYE